MTAVNPMKSKGAGAKLTPSPSAEDKETLIVQILNLSKTTGSWAHNHAIIAQLNCQLLQQYPTADMTILRRRLQTQINLLSQLSPPPKELQVLQTQLSRLKPKNPNRGNRYA